MRRNPETCANETTNSGTFQPIIPRFTGLDSLRERLVCMVQLDANKRPIVTASPTATYLHRS
jgi:hypothetical protein